MFLFYSIGRAKFIELSVEVLLFYIKLGCFELIAMGFEMAQPRYIFHWCGNDSGC